MDGKKDRRNENNKEEIQLMLTENLPKTSILKSQIHSEKVKLIVSGNRQSSGTYFLSNEKSKDAPKNKGHFFS